ASSSPGSSSRISAGRDAGAGKKARRNGGNVRGSWHEQQPPVQDQGGNNGHGTYLYDPVLRQFYPPEMDNARCRSYVDGQLTRPIEELENAINRLSEAVSNARIKDAVVHWFKTDLRLGDNRGLHRAYQLAKEHNVPLICLYILSPEDLTAH